MAHPDDTIQTQKDEMSKHQPISENPTDRKRDGGQLNKSR